MVRGKVMTDSSKDELEKIQKLRAELESKLAAAQRDRIALEEGMQIFREKAAVRELEKKLKEEQNALTNLRIEKKELEDQMKTPTKLSISEAIQKTKAEIENKKDTPETGKEEHSRVIWKKDEQTPESDESSEEQEKKKKRRFF